MPARIRLYKTVKGKVAGVHIRIRGRELEHLETLIDRQEVFCSLCKKPAGIGRPYLISQLILRSKSIQVNVVCKDCCEPIEKAISDALKREQAQPEPKEAATVDVGGGS